METKTIKFSFLCGQDWNEMETTSNGQEKKVKKKSRLYMKWSSPFIMRLCNMGTIILLFAYSINANAQEDRYFIGLHPFGFHIGSKFNIGLANFNRGGLQIGIINSSRQLVTRKGNMFQLGILNFATTYGKGVQLGLLNFNRIFHSEGMIRFPDESMYNRMSFAFCSNAGIEGSVALKKYRLHLIKLNWKYRRGGRLRIRPIINFIKSSTLGC